MAMMQVSACCLGDFSVGSRRQRLICEFMPKSRVIWVVRDFRQAVMAAFLHPPPPKSRTPTCVILWAFRGCIHSSFFKCKMSLWGCSLSTLSEFRPFMRQKTLLQLVFKNLVCLILVENSAPKLLSRPVSIWVVKLQQPTWVKTSEQEKFLPVSSRSFTHLNDQFKCTRASVRVAKFSGFVEYCHWKEHSPKPAAVLHVWLNFNVYASSSQKY